MSPVLTDIASSIIPMVLGSIGTGFVWVIKAVFKAKRDLDFAHQKIRELEYKIGDFYASDSGNDSEYSSPHFSKYGTSASTRARSERDSGSNFEETCPERDE